jgi:hydroxymethylglutaryl-CoA lyase
MISTAFGCGYEGLTAADRLADTLADLLNALKRHNVVPVEVSLADTVGLAEPEGVRRAARWFRNEYPGIRLSLHLHDTRGLGLANAYAGLLEGVDCFDASVGGLGGCPFTPGAAGNIASEDLVYLCDRLGIPTGISHAEYCAVARWLNETLGGAEPAKGKRLQGKSFCAP